MCEPEALMSPKGMGKIYEENVYYAVHCVKFFISC